MAVKKAIQEKTGQVEKSARKIGNSRRNPQRLNRRSR
jgi:hypothetical protein